MSIFKISLTVILISGVIFCQSTEYFPGRLNISPFTANYLEPSTGFALKFGENDLRLDIGTSKDVFHKKLKDNIVLSLGADFFTFTKLQGETDFHFPVVAVDYLFGLNAGLKFVEDKYEYGARLRISHISAHLVDGSYDGINQKWKNNRNPIVYSREFIEIFPFIRFNDVRFYSGLTYIFHSSPEDIGKGIFQLGFDYYGSELISSSLSPFIAYDYKIASTGKYTPVHSAKAGIKWGERFGAGISLFLAYFSGKSVHGEFYELNESYLSAGINIEF